MIGYLQGKVLENKDGQVLLLVGQVGYSVKIPTSYRYLDHTPGKSTEFYIHTHVREDALDLYGFNSSAEKELFLTLLTVNGIGPKGAMGILSKIDPAALVRAILEEDRDQLTAVPGIGKKTAERVVLELSDSVRKKSEGGVLSEFGPSTPIHKSSTSKSSMDSGLLKDAKDALVGLGYRDGDIDSLLRKIIHANGASQKVEDLVRSALKQLS